MNQAMKIFVFILNWNGKEKLVRLKSCLLNGLAALNANYQIYIKDNGSTDNSLIELTNWPNTTISEIGHNRDNFAQGMNYLFEKANPSDEDILLLLNNDVVIDDVYSIKKMYDLMLKTNAGIVGARLLYNNTNKLQHAGVIFGSRYGNMPYHLKHGELSDEQSKKDKYFQAVTAAVCLVKASSFRRVGGFDEGYFWAFEDIDLNLKIGQKEKIAYCGNTTIYHEESSSLKLNPVNKMFMQQNVKRFKDKWWEHNSPKYKIDHELYLTDFNYNVIK